MIRSTSYVAHRDLRQVNATISVISDLCWAYSVLLTSPLVVTVGLSLSIPLSIIGQMIINKQNSSVMYWIGAATVFMSFVWINHQGKVEKVNAHGLDLDRVAEHGALDDRG